MMMVPDDCASEDRGQFDAALNDAFATHDPGADRLSVSGAELSKATLA
jgi:hypothetical protein